MARYTDWGGLLVGAGAGPSCGRLCIIYHVCNITAEGDSCHIQAGGEETDPLSL